MAQFRLPEIWNRHTNRSFLKQKSISLQDIELLLEAASRAPSSFNAQPWRFVYGERESTIGEQLFELFLPSNAPWARGACWYVLLGAQELVEVKGEKRVNPTAFFDSGAACQNFVLQAVHMGIATAVVGGFDHRRAQELVGDFMRPICMIVVGTADQESSKKTERMPLSVISKNTI